MKELLSQLDIFDVVVYGIPVAAVVLGGFWIKSKAKIKALAELLTAFSNAVEDNKIDANEKTDLVEKAKALLGK